MATLAERFDRLVDRTGDHHRWLGAVDRRGTPQMRHNGRLTTARRVAWELGRERLPRGGRVRACPADPRCVHLEHLMLVEPAAPTTEPRGRRRRGEGSLRQLRPDRWQAAITVTTPAGDRQRLFRTITGDRAAAEAALAVLQAEQRARASTLDALVTVYFRRLSDRGRTPETLRRYRQLWRTWLSLTLGSIPPEDFRRQHLEHALRNMADAGQSERSVHQAAVIVNGAFAWAHAEGLVDDNPIPGCRLPNGGHINHSRRR